MYSSIIKFLAKNSKQIIGGVIGAGALAVSAKYGPKVYKNMKEKNDKDKAEEIKKLTDKINNEFLGYFIIMDSNIWMTDFYEQEIDFIHEFCKLNNKKITIPSFQLKEFENPKNKSERFRMTEAKRRIEKFSNDSLINISKEEKKYSYVDDCLLDIIKIKSKSFKKVSILTEDRELRIKAKSLDEFKDKKVLVCSFSDIQDTIFQWYQKTHW